MDPTPSSRVRSSSSSRPSGILIVGDSVPFPRASKGQLLTDSWPSIVQQRSGCEVLWNRARRAATSREVLRDVEGLTPYLAADRPPFDWAIVQVGVVDACPRLLPRWLSVLAEERLPRGSDRAINGAAKLLRLPPRPWISRREFRSNIGQILITAASLAERVAVVSIAPPFHHFVTNAPGAAASIAQYNADLALTVEETRTAHGHDAVDTFHFVDPWVDVTDEWLLPDGHHLTSRGHEGVAAAVLAVMSRCTQERASTGSG